MAPPLGSPHAKECAKETPWLLFFLFGTTSCFRSLKEELQNPSTFDTILTQVPDAHQAAHRLTDWDHETEQAILLLAALLDNIRFVGPWPVVAFAAVRL